MSALNDTRLVLKVCEMYYLQDKSQKEISSQLGISRPQISRMIAQARSSGLVHIQIDNPYRDEALMEQQFIQRYQLKDALVVRSSGGTEEDRMAQFCTAAAPYFDNCLVSGMRLGLMSGKTIAQLVDAMSRSSKRLTEIVPLVGGIGAEGGYVHANTCAQRMATYVYSANALSLNAPCILSHAEVAELICQEPNIHQVLEKGRACDVALVGIGTVQENSTTVKAGGITAEDLLYLREQHAVASICNSFLDEEGRETALALRRRSVGQTLESLGGAKVIACAIGQSKVDAIRAALRSGKIDVLMTNAATARSILAMDR